MLWVIFYSKIIFFLQNYQEMYFFDVIFFLLFTKAHFRTFNFIIFLETFIVSILTRLFLHTSTHTFTSKFKYLLLLQGKDCQPNTLN